MHQHPRQAVENLYFSVETFMCLHHGNKDENYQKRVVPQHTKTDCHHIQINIQFVKLKWRLHIPTIKVIKTINIMKNNNRLSQLLFCETESFNCDM